MVELNEPIWPLPDPPEEYKKIVEGSKTTIFLKDPDGPGLVKAPVPDVKDIKPAMTFRVAYFEVPVFFDDVLEGPENAEGYYDGMEREIHLESALKGTDRGVEVLLHEAIHAIDHAYGLGLKHRQVHGLGSGLVDILKAMYAGDEQ